MSSQKKQPQIDARSAMNQSPKITHINEAYGEIRFPQCSPIRVYGSEKIRKELDASAIEQACNMRTCPGVEGVTLTPDAHCGFGAPIGCVMVSPSHIYPCPVGVDINCSMSLLQLNLPEEAIVEKKLRRELLKAVAKRIPVGFAACAPEGRKLSNEFIEQALVEGATERICREMQIPPEWTLRCEDSVRVGHDGTTDALKARLERVKEELGAGKRKHWNYEAKLQQLGSYGGGNHFGECEIVRLAKSEKGDNNVAKTFGLIDGNVAFLSHCGSRGFGNEIARGQFNLLKRKFETWRIPFPANDPYLVYAPLGTPEADDYIDDMTLGANFATLNHLLINALVLEAFQEVVPGTTGSLVYFISHNIARKEILDGKPLWVHRKGATRAYPANHFSLIDTPFAKTGHPILLPGNPRQGSAVMVALEGAKECYYSINHGAGRAVGRRVAMKTFNQREVDKEFEDADVLVNCRNYPLDEAPKAYKDFNEVLRSVEQAGLARTVARLDARFVVKDSSKPDD